MDRLAKSRVGEQAPHRADKQNSIPHRELLTRRRGVETIVATGADHCVSHQADWSDPSPGNARRRALMTYDLSTELPLPFDQAIDATEAALKDQDFGGVARIDMMATLHNKARDRLQALHLPRRLQSVASLRGFAARGQDRNDASLQRHRAGDQRRSFGKCGDRSARVHAGHP